MAGEHQPRQRLGEAFWRAHHGRIGQRVMVHQGQPAVRRVLPLSLTFDHRVVTGGEVACLLVTLRSDLERPS